jgi:hypothetical protein
VLYLHHFPQCHTCRNSKDADTDAFREDLARNDIELPDDIEPKGRAPRFLHLSILAHLNR